MKALIIYVCHRLFGDDGFFSFFFRPPPPFLGFFSIGHLLLDFYRGYLLVGMAVCWHCGGLVRPLARVDPSVFFWVGIRLVIDTYFGFFLFSVLLFVCALVIFGFRSVGDYFSRWNGAMIPFVLF